MKPRQLLKHYFTGCNGWTIQKLVEIKERGFFCEFDRENYNYWTSVHDTFGNYLADVPSELIEMEKEHYRTGKPFGEYYNITAPTATIMQLNKDLNVLAKSIKQPDRFRTV